MLVELPTGVGSKGARTRTHLVNCAIALFAETSVEQTSIQEISRRAEVSPATFYTHFADKPEITELVMDMLSLELLRQWKAEAVHLSDVRVAAAFSPQWMLQKAHEDPHLGSLLAQSLVGEGLSRESAAASIRRFFAAVPRDHAYSPTDPDDLIKMITAAIAAAIRLVLAGRELVSVQKLTSELVMRMLGVEAPTAREAVEAAHELLTASLSRRPAPRGDQQTLPPTA